MSTSRRGAIVVGVLTLVVATVVTLAWRAATSAPEENLLHVQFRTNLTGDGVGEGTVVRLNGVQVGEVSAVDSAPGGTQVITVGLHEASVNGLGDGLQVRYAPANLFGITDVVLDRGDGGTPLTDGMVVDLTGDGRVEDSTMGTMLRALSETTLTVLTPDLTEVLAQIGTDVRAFAPFIEALVGVGRAVADTQRFPSSFLIEQYAAFFTGAAQFGSGFVKLIDQIYNIDVLRNDRDHFDVGVSLVVDDLFPLITTVLGTAQGYLGGYADTAAVVLSQLARTVPDPVGTQADLTELLDRIDRTLRSTPDGPAVDVDILLRGMPGLMVPLTGGAAPAGGVR